MTDPPAPGGMSRLSFDRLDESNHKPGKTGGNRKQNPLTKRESYGSRSVGISSQVSWADATSEGRTTSDDSEGDPHFSFILEATQNLHEALLPTAALQGDTPSALRRHTIWMTANVLGGSASPDILESFGFLPEMLKHLLDEALSLQYEKAGHLHLIYIQVVVRELQNLMNATILDPGLGGKLDPQKTEEFLFVWQEAVNIIGDICNKHGKTEGLSDYENLANLSTPLQETATSVVMCWSNTSTGPPLCKRLMYRLAYIVGADPEFGLPHDRALIFIFLGLLISCLSASGILLFTLVFDGWSTAHIPPIILTITVYCLTGVFVQYRPFLVGIPLLFIFATSPLVFHSVSSKFVVPWGVLFIPSWLSTAAGVWNPAALISSSLLFVVSFFSRAVLIKFEVGFSPSQEHLGADAADALYLFDVIGGVLVLLFVFFAFIGAMIMQTLSNSHQSVHDAALYRHVALYALSHTKGRSESLCSSGKQHIKYTKLLMNALQQFCTTDMTTQEVTVFVALQSKLQSVLEAGTQHQMNSSHRSMKLVPLTSVKALNPAKQDAARRISDDTPPDNGSDLIGLDDPSPFGELVFPDPMAGTPPLRIDSRIVHNYLGIVVMNFEGEILYWNSLMASLTGIDYDSAVGNEITSFILDSEQQHAMIMMLKSAAKRSERMEWGEEFQGTTKLVAFLKGDGVNRVFLEVHVAPSYLGSYLTLIAATPKQDINTVHFTQWALNQFVPNTIEILSEVKTINNASTDLVDRAIICKKLIESLVDVAGKAQFSAEYGFSHIHLQTMLHKVVSDCSSSYDSYTIRLGTIPPEVPNVIFTHPTKLVASLGNIISHAIRHSPPESVIGICLSVLGTNESVGTLCLSISDNGVGLTREEIHTILDPSQASPDHLSSTNAEIHKLGGHLEIQSEAGQNTTYTVKLPILESDADMNESCQLTSEDQHVEPPRRHGHIKVMVAESNQVFVSAFCQILWSRGYSVVLGDNNICGILEAIEGVDLIIIGIENNEVSAPELLEELKFRQVQVILASRLFTEYHRGIIAEAGWYGLSLPPKKAHLHPILEKAEEATALLHEEKRQIEDLRKAFEGNTQCPWERGELLGSGSFGKVYRATNKLTGGKMAVKVISLSDSNTEDLLQEVTVMACLSHPNIVHYFYCERGVDELRIFMELADSCLSSKLRSDGVDSPEASGFMRDILLGLQYLHSKEIIHRDIKVANVLITKGACKLTDFGTAVKHTTNNSKIQDAAGTMHYMAPEVINGKGYDWRADIWSLGCLLMEMITGKPPWNHVGGGSWQAVKYISTLEPRSEINYGPSNYHSYVFEFLESTVRVDPQLRQATQSLLEMPFLTHMNDDMVRKSSVFTIANQTRKESLALIANFKNRSSDVCSYFLIFFFLKIFR